MANNAGITKGIGMEKGGRELTQKGKHCDVVIRCFRRWEMCQSLAWDAAAGILTGGIEELSHFDLGYVQAMHFAVQSFDLALHGVGAEQRYTLDGGLTASRIFGARGVADFLAAVKSHTCGACERELAAAKVGA